MDVNPATIEFLEKYTVLIIAIVIWEMLWKFIALWKAARNNHKSWYVAMSAINSLGILPIIYLIKHQKS